MKIGILSLQGDFALHAQAIARLGHQPVLVKKPDQLEGIVGLILPGGESTTIIKLLELAGLKSPIVAFYNHGFPVFGTCAGLILIADNIFPQQQFCFGFIPLSIERNAYGSQKDSFIENIAVPSLGEPALSCVFIRAPKISQVSPDVEILAHFQDLPVLVKYKNVLGATFHPELTEDLRIHKLFGAMCARVGERLK